MKDWENVYLHINGFYDIPLVRFVHDNEVQQTAYHNNIHAVVAVHGFIESINQSYD
jgi:hypothetical protein